MVRITILFFEAGSLVQSGDIPSITRRAEGRCRKTPLSGLCSYGWIWNAHSPVQCGFPNSASMNDECQQRYPLPFAFYCVLISSLRSVGIDTLQTLSSPGLKLHRQSSFYQKLSHSRTRICFPLLQDVGVCLLRSGLFHAEVAWT